MRIAMIGSGYVGLVSGTCLADFGHEVTCIDSDAEKIAALKRGEIPIYEPGLDQLVKDNAAAARMFFSTDLAAAVGNADVVFIAVGTPSRRGDGHADLSYVYAVAREVAAALKGFTVVATKSTVPLGTGDEVERFIATLGGVQSLGRAFAILECVALHRDGIGLAELSRVVGLHNSTTFHLTKTLLALGYIGQDKETKRYRVGRQVFALAASALDEIEMVNLATPVLEALSRETGESAHFCVRMGDDVIVIARTSGTGAFQMADRVGVVRPAHCTALGKAILASMHQDQLRHILQRKALTPSTERSITEIPKLLRELESVRRSGIAYDDGEFNIEVRCVAAAVRDFTGHVVGAIGISGPIWRLSDEIVRRHAKIVKAAADRLSADFGRRGGAGIADEGANGGAAD